jgi:hypothetical protein
MLNQKSQLQISDIQIPPKLKMFQISLVNTPQYIPSIIIHFFKHELQKSRINSKNSALLTTLNPYIKLINTALLLNLTYINNTFEIEHQRSSKSNFNLYFKTKCYF